MLAYLFIVLAVVIRFLPHAWHFTPVGAALLFFGANQPRKRMWFPIALLAASDIVLNKFVYGFPVTWETFASTAWYAIAVLIGSLMKENVDIPRVAGASLAGSISFFLISNFGVWVAYNMYPHTLAGLGACYMAAVPFFRGTIAADMLYSLAIFYTPVVVKYLQRHFQGAGNEAAA